MDLWGGEVARGHRGGATPSPGSLLSSRVLTGEQSNTSIILELVDALGAPSNPLICKLFRVLHHGENPDVVVQSALAAAGSTRVPQSVGNVVGQWPDAGAPDGVARGHLAFAQEFLPGVDDAWRVALAAVASGADFTEQARSLGQATAEVHATLAQAMSTRTATDEDVAALTRSMRARHCRGPVRGARPRRLRLDGPGVHRVGVVRHLACAATDPRRLPSRTGARRARPRMGPGRLRGRATAAPG